jgi:hypothetical protein
MYASEMKAHDERRVAIEKLALAVGLTPKDHTAIVKSLVFPSMLLSIRHPLTV